MDTTRRSFLAVLLGLFGSGFLRAMPGTRVRQAAADLGTGEWDSLHPWQRASRQPVWESDDPLARRLIRAVRSGDSVALRYCGGSTPGAARMFTPALVFRVGGYDPLYASGYCHRRGRNRTLRLDRIAWPLDSAA